MQKLKLKLKIEELAVASFRVDDDRMDTKGTVHAQSAQEEYGDSEASGCTCTTGGTAFFTEGCAFTAGWKTC
jgi:hypothetical protein